MWDPEQAESQGMTLPQDPLCKWLGHRWESMQELAIAIERERRGQKPGQAWGDAQGERVKVRKGRYAA